MATLVLLPKALRIDEGRAQVGVFVHVFEDRFECVESLRLTDPIEDRRMEPAMDDLSRRAFLKQSAITTASAALLAALPEHLAAESLAKSAGIQLYTVGKELTQDLAGTLAKLAAIGYRVVESAGLAGKTAAEFRKALDDAGLKCPSSHLFLSPGQTAQQYYESVKTLGSEYAVSSVIIKPDAGIKSVDDYVKMIGAMTQDDYKKMAAELNTMAAQAKATGLEFAYHNHNMEFRTWPDGTTTYDILMSETDASLVKIELDCGWADLGGHPPLELFKKYAGRFRMLHIKDFVPVSGPVTTLDPRTEPEWTELGKGHINYRAILHAAPAAGVQYIFVEQEPPFVKFTALEAAKVDYDYLHSIG
jgi:sugar phosphate isomerase/epimerase